MYSVRLQRSLQLYNIGGFINLNSFSTRMKALVRGCVGSVGRLLRHPSVIGFLLRVSGAILIWLLKLLVIALVSQLGLAIPAM